jgi:nucleoside 2-deoxyribosyltransferase
MHFLKNKTVYLCGNIFGVTNDGKDWREFVSPKLLKIGIKVSNPCLKKTDGSSEVGDDKKKFRKLIMQEKWGEIKEEFWPIIRNDLRSVDKCDFVILNYYPDVPTIGTIHELVVANFEKKPILLKYEKSKLNQFNPWMCVFIKSHHFFSEWDDLFEYLKEVDKGKKDTSLWVM